MEKDISDSGLSDNSQQIHVYESMHLCNLQKDCWIWITKIQLTFSVPFFSQILRFECVFLAHKSVPKILSFYQVFFFFFIIYKFFFLNYFFRKFLQYVSIFFLFEIFWFTFHYINFLIKFFFDVVDLFRFFLKNNFSFSCITVIVHLYPHRCDNLFIRKLNIVHFGDSLRFIIVLNTDSKSVRKIAHHPPALFLYLSKRLTNENSFHS